MRAVLPSVPQHVLDARRRAGADRWDEMWNGVLHMPPMPNREHQNLEAQLERWLREFWAEPQGYRVFHGINVAAPGAWPHDYRVPDLVLLMPDRFHVDRNEYFDGAPTVAVEIHSEGDEAYEKLNFYARIGTPEVWIIDRDSRTPEVYVLQGGGYEPQGPDADGWLTSRATGIELRSEPPDKLALRIAGQPRTQGAVP